LIGLDIENHIFISDREKGITNGVESAFLKPFTSTAANILQIISSNALEIRFGLYFGMQPMPKLKRLLQRKWNFLNKKISLHIAIY
jgi:hypothetical protein